MKKFLHKFWHFLKPTSYSKSLQLIVILIIAISIPLVVYVQQKQQTLKQHAAGDQCTYSQSCGGSSTQSCTGTMQDGTCKYDTSVPTNCSVCSSSNYCTHAGYTPCTPGQPVGTCQQNGQTCTQFAHYQCNFNGQNYCDTPTCSAPCNTPTEGSSTGGGSTATCKGDTETWSSIDSQLQTAGYGGPFDHSQSELNAFNNAACPNGSTGGTGTPAPSGSTTITFTVAMPYAAKTQRTMQVKLNDAKGTTSSVNLTFMSTDTNGNTVLTGTADLGTSFTTGTYDIRIDSAPYIQIIPGATITAGQNNSAAPTDPMLIGDINGDWKIDIADYNILWGCNFDAVNSSPVTSDCKKADLNNDGVVDGIDYNILVRGWLRAEKNNL